MSTQPVAYYDDPAYNYAKYWQGREYEDKAERIALNKLLSLVKKKDILADIGGGYGRLTPVYAEQFEKVFLVDPSKRMLKEGERFKKDFPNLEFKRSFAEKLPFHDNFLDVAIMIRTFHHIDKPLLVIKEISRVIKPGGFWILEFANKIHFKNSFKAILSLDFDFFREQPEDIGTKEGVTPFFNYHPEFVEKLLKKNRFKIIRQVSVSNFRNVIFKKTIPLPILIRMESFVSSLSAYLVPLNHFGPSIFILAQKTKN